MLRGTVTPGARRTAALVPVLVGTTLVATTISSLGAPLLPSVAKVLHVSLGDAQWSLTASLLCGAVAAPIMGRLGDGPFRRESLIAALVIVFAGGIVAGLAHSLPVLVAGRAMQGVALGIAPLMMAAARDHLPSTRAPAIIGLLSVSGAAGVGAGYPISGLIAQDLDVHAAFLFGSVISLAALAVVLPVIPSSRESSRVPLDIRGAAILSAGLIALLLAIGQGAAWGWSSASILGLFAAALVILAGWARTQLATRSPLVNLRELRHRAVLVGDIAALITGVAMYMFLTIVTEFVQARPQAVGYGFGSSILVAGLCLVPFSVTSLTASRTVPALLRRVQNATVLITGAAMIAVGGAFFAIEHSALWEAFVTMGFVGVGFGYTFAAIPGMITSAVPAGETGSAMGLYQVIRYVGFSLGSALTASILASGTIAGRAVPPEQSYITGLWVGSGICLLSAAASWALARGGTPAPKAGLLPEPERMALIREDAELASAGLIGVEVAERPRDPRGH